MLPGGLLVYLLKVKTDGPKNALRTQNFNRLSFPIAHRF